MTLLTIPVVKTYYRGTESKRMNKKDGPDVDKAWYGSELKLEHSNTANNLKVQLTDICYLN